MFAMLQTCDDGKEGGVKTGQVSIAIESSGVLQYLLSGLKAMIPFLFKSFEDKKKETWLVRSVFLLSFSLYSRACR